MKAALRNWKYRDVFDFAICAEGTHQFLGAVTINQLHPVHHFANLGYGVRGSCTGHGIAVTAVHLCAQCIARK